MPTPSIQTLTTDAQQVLNLDSISAVRSVVAVALANANTGTPLNPNLTTQQLWDQFYQVVTKPKSDIESIIANQLMKFLYSPPAPGGAGADKQVIFNDGGVLAGAANLYWNKVQQRLGLGTNTPNYTLDVVGSSYFTGSATITGDLTVDTNTLKVDSANNRVGIGTASPATALQVVGEIRGSADISNSSDTIVYSYNGGTAGTVRAGIQFIGSTPEIRSYLSGTTAMTLNSGGLGVGVAASALANSNRIEVKGLLGSNYTLRAASTNVNARDWMIAANINSFGDFAIRQGNSQGAEPNSGTDRFYIDLSGNVGIGVTPSAWGSSYKALQMQSLAFTSDANSFYQSNNAFINSTPAWTYIASKYAVRYDQDVSGGNHKWFNAPSGTAGQTTTVTSGNNYTITAAGGTNYTTFGAANNNVGTTFTASSSGTGNGGGVTQNITWTQAMTLDASGRLLVAKTASGTGSTGCELQTGAGGNSASVFTADGAFASIMNRLTSDGIIVDLRRQTLTVGNISVTTTGATFNSTSDYRLKEDVQPLVGGLARVSALKPSIYKWKSNGSNGEGFLAHELAEVVPAAVTGEKDAVNEDGSIKAQSVDMSRVVPILVAAIQELAAEVNALKNA